MLLNVSLNARKLFDSVYFSCFSRYCFYSPERKMSDFQDLTPSTRRNLFISLWNPFWCGEETLKQEVSSRVWKRKDCLDYITKFDENLSIYLPLPTYKFPNLSFFQQFFWNITQIYLLEYIVLSKCFYFYLKVLQISQICFFWEYGDEF